MAVTLTHSRTGDVAVVSVGGEAALTFLCRSLASGAALANVPRAVAKARQWQRLVLNAPGASPGAARTATRAVTGLLRVAVDVIGQIGPARARFPRWARAAPSHGHGWA